MPDWYWQRPPEPPPPPPPPRARWSDPLFGHWRRPIATWTRHGWNNTAVTVTVLVVLVVCSIGGLAAALRGSLGSGTGGYTFLSGDAVSATETSVVATANAQSTAIAHGQPTATPKGPHPVSGPYLGGTQADFAAAFGQPTTTYGQTYYPFTTSAGLPGQVCFCSPEAGTDGQQRAPIVSITVPGLDYSQAPAVIRRFFPPDAHQVGSTIDPQLGPMQFYQSADLALTFPAADFQKGSGPPGLAPPGTFGIACQDPSQSTCTIALGE
jgi:hypothetical protein